MMKIGLSGVHAFGAREHVLAETLRRLNPHDELFFYPGNFETASFGTNVPIKNIDEVIAHAKSVSLDFLIIGPEGDLEAGIADISCSIPVFGPGKEGAKIESDKHFAKKIMQEKGVRTAPFVFFEKKRLLTDALSYIRKKPFPLVIKSCGLAGGKGVLVLHENDAIEKAEDFLRSLAEGGYAGSAEKGVLIEDFLPGREASIFYLVHAEKKIACPFLSAQDHKRLQDGDAGPNTGGMGAFSENPLVDEKLTNKVTEEIVLPVLEGLTEKNIPYVGILYAGLMIDKNRPSVVEFNCRFGDPEIQVLAPRLQSSLSRAMIDVYHGRMPKLLFDDRKCLNVVLAMEGYPGSCVKGKEIFGLDDIPQDISIYHAGVKREGNQSFTNGGRIMSVVSFGNTLEEAHKKVYRFLEEKKVTFEGMIYRTDIGKKL